MKYLGYKNLKDMVAARKALGLGNRTRPILYFGTYASDDPPADPGGARVAVAEFHVQALDPTNPDIIMYWFMRLGRYGVTDAAGIPHSPAVADRARRAGAAAEAAFESWAGRVGCTAEPATFAYPTDMRIVYGDPIISGITYDSAAGRFAFDPPPPPAVDPFGTFLDRGGMVGREASARRVRDAMTMQARISASAAPGPAVDDMQVMYSRMRDDLLLHAGEPIPDVPPAPPIPGDRWDGLTAAERSRAQSSRIDPDASPGDKTTDPT